MFIITFGIDTGTQWSTDFYFDKFADAEEYLNKKGYVKSNRIFTKESDGWFPTTKAFIKPLKRHSQVLGY